MPYYILLTHNVSNLGGGQLYTLRRAKYLLKKGYKVIVIDHFKENNFILKEKFKGCRIIHIPEIIEPIVRYSPKKSEAIINRLINLVGPLQEDIFIETHAFQLSVWGEKLAIKLNARHLVYCYEEWNTIKNYRLIPGKPFFDRKYQSNQFFGCTSQSIRILFGDIYSKNNYLNIPFDESEIEDKCIPSLQIFPEKDYFTIGTVSRLEKTYIIDLIESIGLFAASHPSQKVRLIIAGDSKDQSVTNAVKQKVENIGKDHPNMTTIMTGYISVLGKDLFELCDVFVGMGTASINAISQNVVTINIDPLNDNRTSGFFGVDTATAAFAENGKTYSIFEKIEEAYNFSQSKLDEVKRVGRGLFESNFSVDSIFPQLDEAIEKIPQAKDNRDLKYSLSYHLYYITKRRIRRFGGFILRKLQLR